MKSNALPTIHIKDVGEDRAFFISANGYSGFRTRQGALYRSEEFARVFVILGGPGTGKSSLMRTVADAAVLEGAACEYIYCSSDPDSLDGVILKKGGRRVALLDGTAPHERGASFPGVIDEFVHLSSCWNTDTLIEKRGQILGERKAASEACSRAWEYLAMAGEVQKSLEGALDSIIDQEKLHAAVARELRTARVSNHPFEEVRYLSGFGGKGLVRLNTFCKDSEIITVSNECGAAHRYLDEMAKALRHEGVYEYFRFPSCFDDEITEGIYLPRNKRLYLIDNGEKSNRKINIKRFINKEKEATARVHIRRLLRLQGQMLGTACEYLQDASEHHFALEEIYGRAMDFSKKEIMAFLLGRQVCAYLDLSVQD